MQSAPHLAVTDQDLTAETRPHFFTADQLATITKLGSILMPPMKGKPGAVEAQAPEQPPPAVCHDGIAIMMLQPLPEPCHTASS